MNFSFASRLRRAAAFTLIEIMIAVTLMSIIILGLVAMFTQTQRAFRLGMNQTDVLEAGRIATDLIVRELEQVSPSMRSNSATPGFFVELPSLANTGVQVLPGGDLRTNIMSDLFFTTRNNQLWTGIGYFVRTNPPITGAYGSVGTLYRYQTNNSVLQFNGNQHGMWFGYNFARGNGVLTNVTKVLEGVVHFHVRAYDSNGVQIVSQPDRLGFINTQTNRVTSHWIAFSATNSVFFPSEYNYRMSSNAVPAFVELEIGILENDAYERYKNLPTELRKNQYYRTNLSANVHLFRQRIPIRRVDLTAYQ